MEGRSLGGGGGVFSPDCSPTLISSCGHKTTHSEKVGSTEETQLVPPRKISHHCTVSQSHGDCWGVLALFSSLSPSFWVPRLKLQVWRLLLLMSLEGSPSWPPEGLENNGLAEEDITLSPIQTRRCLKGKTPDRRLAGRQAGWRSHFSACWKMRLYSD